MALKLDNSKAHDKVYQEFMYTVPGRIGFNHKIVGPILNPSENYKL